MNPEPTELIGTGKTSDMGYVMDSIKAVKDIDPRIIVEQAASISSGEDVYKYIYAGSEAAGAASGIAKAADPHAMIDEMVYNVRKAWEDRQKDK
jgi:triosephosphate isomerase